MRLYSEIRRVSKLILWLLGILFLLIGGYLDNVTIVGSNYNGAVDVVSRVSGWRDRCICPAGSLDSLAVEGSSSFAARVFVF